MMTSSPSLAETLLSCLLTFLLTCSSCSPLYNFPSTASPHPLPPAHLLRHLLPLPLLLPQPLLHLLVYNFMLLLLLNPLLRHPSALSCLLVIVIYSLMYICPIMQIIAFYLSYFVVFICIYFLQLTY
jgi:hypothetical protein